MKAKFLLKKLNARLESIRWRLFSFQPASYLQYLFTLQSLFMFRIVSVSCVKNINIVFPIRLPGKQLYTDCRKEEIGWSWRLPFLRVIVYSSVGIKKRLNFFFVLSILRFNVFSEYTRCSIFALYFLNETYHLEGSY